MASTVPSPAPAGGLGVGAPPTQAAAPGAANDPHTEIDPFGPLAPLPPRGTTVLDTGPGWRRLGFGLAAGGAGLGLIAGLSFKVVESQKVREFNAYMAPGGPTSGPFSDRCISDAPNAGAPGCADLLSDSRRARLWSNIGFAMAGTLALTALVIQLTAHNAATATATATATGSATTTASVPRSDRRLTFRCDALASACQIAF